MARIDRITVFSIIIIVLVVMINIYLFIIHYKNSLRNGHHHDRSIASERLVWPEDLPVGDRIREQINYVPRSYKYENSPIKTILVFTGQDDVRETPKLDQEEFFSCTINQCMLTINMTLAPEVDAVLFQHSYTSLLYERPLNQIWIILHTLEPYSTPDLTDIPVDVFNWTATYRWDSDIPIPYGYFVEYLPKLPIPKIYKNYAENKTKQVVGFISNCHPNSNRSMYVNELSKHISVDVFGNCGTLKCSRENKDQCFQMLSDKYKFYLAFENAHCIYYITEKLFNNALKHNILPIVMGPSRKDYELVAPYNSFIHVDDFESPKNLAEYLHKLDLNDTLYNEYFKWKGTGTIIIDSKFYCRLCAMLHDEDHPPKYYNDINDWWNGTGVCRR